MSKLNYSLFFTIVLFFLTFNIVKGQDEWILYKADALLSFEIQVPDDMGIKTKEINTDLGIMTTTTYAHEGAKDDANFLYVVNIVEYPAGVFPKDSLDLKNEFLLQSIESIVVGVKGELVYESEILEDGNGQGRLFRIKYNEDYGIIKGKIFIKDDVFTTLQVYTTKEKSLNDEMDVFLNSYKARF